MTDQQLNELVASIGDEMLTRLGLSGSVVVPARPSSCSCGCKTDGVAHMQPPADWTPQVVEFDCRDARLTASEVRDRCLQAQQLGLGAVNVLPGHVIAAATALRGTQTKLVVSVGWPHGTTSTSAKAVESELALGQGADEIEVTVPVGSILASDDDQVYGELRFIAELVHGSAKHVTAAIETTDMEQSRLIAAAAVARLAQVDAVSAASSLATHETASPAVIDLLQKVVGDEMIIKASGGASNATDTLALVAAGASVVILTNLSVVASLVKPPVSVR